MIWGIGQHNCRKGRRMCNMFALEFMHCWPQASANVYLSRTGHCYCPIVCPCMTILWQQWHLTPVVSSAGNKLLNCETKNNKHIKIESQASYHMTEPTSVAEIMEGQECCGNCYHFDYEWPPLYYALHYVQDYWQHLWLGGRKISWGRDGQKKFCGKMVKRRYDKDIGKKVNEVGYQ